MTDNETVIKDVYKIIDFQLNTITNDLTQHVTTPLEYLKELNSILAKSRKYYYIIARHLYPVNI